MGVHTIIFTPIPAFDWRVGPFCYPLTSPLSRHSHFNVFRSEPRPHYLWRSTTIVFLTILPLCSLMTLPSIYPQRVKSFTSPHKNKYNCDTQLFRYHLLELSDDEVKKPTIPPDTHWSRVKFPATRTVLFFMHLLYLDNLTLPFRVWYSICSENQKL